MKVALLLSGLPRMVNEGYEQTWKHIIENYVTDVYMHGKMKNGKRYNFITQAKLLNKLFMNVN